MFGWDDYVQKKMKGVFEQSMVRMDAYNVLPPRFIKALEWVSEKFIPFLMNIGGMIVLIWIFNRIMDSVGFEKTVIYLLCIFLGLQRFSQK